MKQPATMLLKSCLATGAFMMLSIWGARAEAPQVAVSIQPVHSLVAAVMTGIRTPELLVGATSSEHTYTMRPSEARILAEAELVFWVGDALESFLVKPLSRLAADATVIKIADLPRMKLLPLRAGGAWDEHHRDHGSAHDQEHAAFDAHLWLDPENAKLIVASAAAELARVDPGNAERYRQNAKAVAARLDRLDDDLRQKLAPAKGRAYIVLHDAYRYFEHRYELQAVGSILVSPERRPGARRITQIRDKIAASKAVCVFAEPQFKPDIVATVLEDTAARSGILDGLGADLTPGPDAYFQMMQRLADSLTRCLGRPTG